MTTTLSSNGYIGCPVGTIPTPAAATKNLFEKVDTMVNTIRNECALIEITLVRDGVERELVATPDSTVFRWNDENMMTMRKESRDFIINVEDYRTGLTAFAPEKFDIIRETDPLTGITYEYQVGAWNDEPPYKFTGAYRKAYRVHTKLIDE